MAKPRVGIVGASGYGGAELARLVLDHPGMELAALAAHSHADEAVADRLPNLEGVARAGGAVPRRFFPIDEEALAELDLVFLSTPHGVAAELAPRLVDEGTPVVDLSAAFRLPPVGWSTWYGGPHPRPDLLPAPYGLTEWNRTAVRTARLVANPGCYPTATLLGILPLLPLIEVETLVVDAKSGTSGAGRTPRDDLHHPEVAENVVPYGAPRHRHTGEMEHGLELLAGASTRLVFTPHLVPMARGLLATCYATLREGVSPADVRAALEERYREEPFVHLLPSGRFPRTKALAGSNGCHLAAVVEERSRRVVVLSAIDNLGKGAAGQALQNANLMLGLEEPLGLAATGVYP